MDVKILQRFIIFAKGFNLEISSTNLYKFKKIMTSGVSWK